jgi:pimeloyl-ACP methyl ester carboxylesterase
MGWKSSCVVLTVLALVVQAPLALAQTGDPRGSNGAHSLGGSKEEVVEMPLSDGQTQRVLYVAPANARGTIVMLPGGEGNVGLEDGGDIRHGHNFVVRTRSLWNARGYAVLIPDTVDHANLRGHRSTPEYAHLVRDLVTFAHRRINRPVFLLGTSQGSIAAMNGASHAEPDSIAGVVLTESVSVLGGSGETVFDADPRGVRVPALIVANRDDRCNVAPPGAAHKIAQAMSSSHDVTVMDVEGGMAKSATACGSLTPHGYYGIEDDVVSRIAHWLDDHAG